MKIKRVLFWRKAPFEQRLRLVRVEMATSCREWFVSLSLAPRLWALTRGYHEYRVTVLGVQVHYRLTAWHSPEVTCEACKKQGQGAGR